jgi:pantoate--beta-alanine ligase
VTPVRTIAELRAALAPHRAAGARIGLVPTMGSYHEGHLTLFRGAAAECDLAVASLFVNPTQFGPNEDLARYPRDEARDAQLSEAAGIGLLFAPSVDEMYPAGFATTIDPGPLATVLEGAFRPGHFAGVATVCTKLFSAVGPAVAYFGRKDAQQVAVIKQIVRDLDLPLEIRVVPTVRGPDGLALSSRNVYLSAEDRARALALPRGLQAGRAAYRGGRGADGARSAARAIIEGMDGITVDYVEVADLDGLTLAAAVRVGSTRLIDNVLLNEEAP